MQQFLHYSQACTPWSEARLVALLAQARAYNQAHAIFYWLLDYLRRRQQGLLSPQVSLVKPALLALLAALQHGG